MFLVLTTDTARDKGSEMAEYSFEGGHVARTRAWLTSIASLVISKHIDERRTGAPGDFAVLGPTKAGRLRAQWNLVEPYVKSLSRPQRGVVRLRFREGMCYADIAGRLGIPIGTVRSRLARARIAIDRLSEDAIGPVDLNPGESFGPGPAATPNGNPEHSDQASFM